MKGVAVNFQLANDTRPYAFRRLTILPRVGEIVEFNDTNFMVMQLVHRFHPDTDEQVVYIAIGEVR